jgi:hypothetical protein
MELIMSAKVAASNDVSLFSNDQYRPATRVEPRALFHVTGVADPGLLPRLIEPVAKLGYTPTRLHMSREDGDGTVVSVDLRLGGVPMVDASRVEGALRSVVGVLQVIAVYEGGTATS